MKKPTKQQYKARNGTMQWMPSVELVMALAAEGEGFCLACGEEAGNVEPDARRYTCECCGADKVYGAEQLALMGLTF